jgi:hypothetical protein
MKTHLSLSTRFQTGLLVATASLGLLAIALVFPLRASSAMPSMPAAASQPPAAGSMPMGGDMKDNMGPMMKNMGAMMDKMSSMMAAAPAAGKPDAMPMADMARMSAMMKNMSTMMGMMGAMGSGPYKTDARGGMDEMCSCCDMMAGKMDMMKDAASKTTPPNDATESASDVATDHAAHH